MTHNKKTISAAVRTTADKDAGHEDEPGANDSLEQTSLVEEVAELREQLVTLEELLQVYEESATEQSERLQGMLDALQEKAHQLGHAREALQTLKGILHSMGDAVVVLSSDGQALFVNLAARQLLGGQALEVSFQRWLADHYIFDSDGDTLHSFESSPLAKALRGEPVDAEEMQVLSHSGDRSQWLSVNARPITDEEMVTGAVAVLRDVTERKAFEQALKQSNEEAQQQAHLLENTLYELKQTQAQLVHGEKMASLGKTVAGIAHEINNPVSFIHGNLSHMTHAFDGLMRLVQLFQSAYFEIPNAITLPSYERVTQATEEIDLDFLAEDMPRMLDSMTVGTCRIREIVKSLRLFARLDEAEVKAIDIREGLDSALLIVHSQLSGHPTRPNIVLQCCYGDCPPLECYASQLNQVFVHLLSNAIESFSASSADPQIIIRTYANPSTATIEIEDNGDGIPADIRPKIFDPFFTTKPIGESTGLGLSICYQIVVSTHNGSLECFSEVGKGTRFVIALPI